MIEVFFPEKSNKSKVPLKNIINIKKNLSTHAIVATCTNVHDGEYQHTILIVIGDYRFTATRIVRTSGNTRKIIVPCK